MSHPSATPQQRKGKPSGVLKRSSEAEAPVKIDSRNASLNKTSGGSMGRAAGTDFVYDPKQSAEANALRKRALEEGQKQDATVAAEFVYNTNLSPEENLVNQRNWEGQQRLNAAMARLHHDKSMIAKASQPKEDQAVNGYMARFAQKLQKKKAKNPTSSNDDIAEEMAAVASASSNTLRPGAIKLTDAYLENYKSMTPQAALKKRLLMSEAEKVVNEKGQTDSYLNRFLEDKVDAPAKKGHHVRRSSDSTGVPAAADDAAARRKVEAAAAAADKVKKRESTSGRRRSNSNAAMRRTSSSTMPSLSKREAEAKEDAAERRLTKERLLAVEQQKVLLAASPAASRLRANNGTSSVESSDVEESSSTFESDDEADAAATATTATTPKKSGVKKVRRKVSKSRRSSLAKIAAVSRTASQPALKVREENAAQKAVKVGDDELPKLLRLGEELGKGAFSLVYKAERLADGLPVAVKVIDLSRLTPKQLAEVDAERIILQQFHHPNVVNLLNVYETVGRLYYVLELLPSGDLFNKILQKGCFSERATKRVVRQITEAVAAMHALGIVHRDLKVSCFHCFVFFFFFFFFFFFLRVLTLSQPENVLCMEDAITKQIDVKVADFGIAKKIGRGRAKSTCGSPGYVAPEVIRGEEYDMSVDMFSLGAIVYVLLAGYPPFWGDEMETIVSKNLNVDFTFNPMYWAHISEPPKQLIKALIVKDSAARLTAAQVLQSDFLK